jgi:predicted component of type VI protein secretion system
MIITKKHLSRRTVLRGMGAAIALPLMESMMPALTASARTAANPQRRFGMIFVPLGERPGYWTPKEVGSNFEMSPILKPLESFRSYMTLVSELCVPLDGHAVTTAAWPTGSLPKRTIAEDVRAGTSVDQVIANAVGQDTVYPSLELATEDFTGYIGGCDTQYACAYMNTLSWKSPTQPLPMEINPRTVFERMFGRAGTSQQRLARMGKDRSILDSVREDITDLQNGLGAQDRTRLTEYLENVREIERRIQRAEQRATTDLKVPDAPVGIPESFEDHVALQFDLLALAFEADVTRVFSFMLSRDASQRVYPGIGITEPHHSMSHHGGNPEKVANLVKLNTYHIALFGKFLDRLRNTRDGEGSLLDHSILLWGSGMSESNNHSRLDLPTLLVGGGAGAMKGNRHIKAAPQTPMANLMLSLTEKFGVEAQSFGISTGRVEI